MKRESVYHGAAMHIMGCPIPMQTHTDGEPYANALDHCLHCPFAESIEQPEVSDEADPVMIVDCPETLTEEQKNDPRLWGWGEG